jgi:hypothetical protein
MNDNKDREEFIKMFFVRLLSDKFPIIKRIIIIRSRLNSRYFGTVWIPLSREEFLHDTTYELFTEIENLFKFICKDNETFRVKMIDPITKMPHY